MVDEQKKQMRDLCFCLPTWWLTPEARCNIAVKKDTCDSTQPGNRENIAKDWGFLLMM